MKTKPVGALGILEQLAHKIGMIQETLEPVLRKPSILVFAGDHGIAKEGVSAYPQEVTYQMVVNFLHGGAAINVFSKQHAIELKIVDAGVNYSFEQHPSLLDTKIALGTNSFLSGSAMTNEQFVQSVAAGRKLVKTLAAEGTNVIGFGEMGIGNTSAATMLMSYFCNLPIAACVGKGTGLNDVQLQNKIDILQAAKDFHGSLDSPEAICTAFAGFEMAQMYGAMLEAYEQKMILLVDGFIASSVFLAAYTKNPALKNNAIFCHLSDENGHKQMLEYLEATPLLQLGMRLGEGTGCAVAYPLLVSAVSFLNEMASFESAGVSDKENSEFDEKTT